MQEGLASNANAGDWHLPLTTVVILGLDPRIHAVTAAKRGIEKDEAHSCHSHLPQHFPPA